MRTRNKPALIFFCLLLSAAAVLAGANIYSELKERQKEKKDFAAVSQIAEPTVTTAQTETEPTEQPAAERNIQALITENADCIGWLSIDGTNISYPVMHTPSNPQKYLRRNFYGKYSQSGVPFLDGRCDLQSINLIIYGHNMRNGTMFGSLKKLLNDPSIIEEDPYIYIFTKEKVKMYEICAAYITNDSSHTYDLTQTAEEQVDYVKYIRNVATYYWDDPMLEESLTEDTRLITLSTCHGLHSNNRTVIHGVLVASKDR